MKKIFCIALVLLIVSGTVIYNTSPNLSDKNVTRSNINKVKQFTKQLVKENNQNIPFDIIHFSWEAEGARNNWSYYNGIMMFALLKTGEYNSFVDAYYNDILKTDGSINNEANNHNVSHLFDVDSVPPVRTLLYLSSSQNFQKYKANIEDMKRRLETHPTLPHCGGNLKHQALNQWWQKFPLALDGLYMALPFLIEYENLANQIGLNYKNEEIYDLVFHRLDWVSQNMHNTSNIYYHVISEDGKNTNGIAWLRAVGWYAMAQVDVIEKMPESENKNIMKKQLSAFFDSMLLIQSKNGMWRNVLHYDNENFHSLGLLNNSCNNYETSGTLMMAYALMKAYSNQYVTDKKYAIAGLNAFNGTISKYLYKDYNGKYTLTNIYRSTGASTDIYYYTYCKGYLKNEAKGIAPLILASLEAERIIDILDNPER